MSFGAAAQHLGMSVAATKNAREFSSAIDPDPRAWYFRQAGSGMFIRRSLLEWIFESD